MSLFIAGVSFPDAADFAAAKVAVFAGSLCAAACGVALLWWPRSGPRDEHPFGASDAAHAGTPV
jgi:NhaA family Na+:H+ antiporter